MANELELELLEVEILESRIRRLESRNQDLLQENQRLTATVAHLETTNSRLDSSNDLLLEENERLRSIVSDLHKAKSKLAEELETLKIDFRDREKTLELENLITRTCLDDFSGNQTAIDEKSKQIERLLSEIDELERNYDEDRRELRKLEREKEALATENERMESQIDRITEDNTVVILTLLTTQSDLEADLEKQREIIRDFFQRAVLMVRKTAEMLEREEEEEMNGGDFAEGLDSTVEMLLRPLEVELAGVKRAFWNRIAGNEMAQD